MQVSLTQLGNVAEVHRNQNLSQSPHIKKDPLGTTKLRTASNVVQLNASEFNLRLTNNSKLSSSSKHGPSMPYQ